MSISPFGSKIYKDLFSDNEISPLFSDKQHLRSLIDVEIALAKVQGEKGIIPAEAASKIIEHINSGDILLKELTLGTAKDGVVVPTLVNHLRKTVGGDAANYIHYGVTSQDIIDTALVLQLRKVIVIFENRIDALIKILADLTDKHRNTIMAARTRSQISTPTTFGLKAANWLMPLIRHKTRLNELKERLLVLSFGGASGTLSALSEKDALTTAKSLKEELNLALPPLPWHNQRDTIAELSSFCALLTGSIAKIANDIIFLSASGINELTIKGGGGSSTMPQKNNPVLAEAIIALAKTNIDLSSSLMSAQIHNNERDGAAWQVEWLTLPKCLNTTGACLNHIINILNVTDINAHKMLSNIEATNGTILAEAAVSLLTENMSKEDAHKVVSDACQKAMDTNTHLFDILAKETITIINWQEEKQLNKHIGLSNIFIAHTIAAISN